MSFRGAKESPERALIPSRTATSTSTLKESVTNLQIATILLIIGVVFLFVVETPLGVLGAISFARTQTIDEKSDSTSGLACDGGVVAVATSTCPLDGQILVATSNETAEWTTFANGTTSADDLVCTDGIVDISGSTCPINGYVLTATSNTTAEWLPLGNGTISANELECDGGIIVISAATCPTVGQVLTAIDNATAEWATPVNLTGIDELECLGGMVVVSGSACPAAGQVLTAIDNSTAEWLALGNGTLSANELECNGGTITVSAATCPTPGQVLTAIDNATAEWSTPGNTTGVDEIECLGGMVVISGSACPDAGQVLTAIDNSTAQWATPTSTLTQSSANGTANFYGPWAVNETATFELRKIGDMVMMKLGSFVGDAVVNATIQSDAFIPAEYRPSTQLHVMMVVIVSGVSTTAVGDCRVNVGGSFSLSAGVPATDFTAGGAAGTPSGGQTISWLAL